MKKININIGCGGMLTKNFINVDGFITEQQMKDVYKQRKAKFPTGATFVNAMVQDLPFKKNYADYIESIDMIEHIPMRLLCPAFSEMHRVLKKGGMLRIVTTSFDDVVRSWLDASRELTEKVTRGEDISNVFDPTFEVTEKGWEDAARKRVNLAMMVIYGNQFHGGEFHMNAFTPATMFVYLQKAGFKKKNIKIIVHEKGSITPRFPGQKNDGIVSASLLNEIIVVEATK